MDWYLSTQIYMWIYDSFLKCLFIHIPCWGHAILVIFWSCRGHAILVIFCCMAPAGAMAMQYYSYSGARAMQY